MVKYLALVALYAVFLSVHAGDPPVEELPWKNLFAPNRNGYVPTRKCINMGSLTQSWGPFRAEGTFVKWTNTEPSFHNRKFRRIANTKYDRAFSYQRARKTIEFAVKVPLGFRYIATFGFAEIDARKCSNNARIIEVQAGRIKKTGIDIFKNAGCDTAYFQILRYIFPEDDGTIRIKVTGLKENAVLAALCLGRRKLPGNSPAVSTTPTAAPSSTPSAMPSSTPTAAPSMSATPTASSTPSPPVSPSPSAQPLSRPSACQQNGCFNLRGRADYKIIGNTMSYDEDRQNCNVKSSSMDMLYMPAGARVVKAILYWSASGNPSSRTSVDFNGASVTADVQKKGGYRQYQFYGAYADVTDVVRDIGNAGYTVSGIYSENKKAVCRGNAVYAAWAMAVVYEKVDLPEAQINLCTDNFTFTFPAGSYPIAVKCFAGNPGTKNAKTTVVTFESDNYKGEEFYINEHFVGNNLFKGHTGPNLDIRSFGITAVAKEGPAQVVYKIRSYLTNSVWGYAIEGMFMPMIANYVIV